VVWRGRDRGGMHLVVVQTAGDSAAPDRAEIFRLAVLSSAGPDDGLEHVFAEPTEDGVAAVFFLVADSVEAAELHAWLVCQRAAPIGADGYVITKCESDLITAIEEARLHLPPDG
jgi:hypothetical protein